MSNIIKTEKLTYKYHNEQALSKQVIDNLDFEIEKGSFVAVLGHNGSGKSTLAKHFNALLLPVSGKVYIDGMDTLNHSLLYEIRSSCGLVFQNPDNQLIATVVEEDVAFAPENMGVEREEIRKRVDEALKCVKMYEYRNKSPHHLSGGQKQRVAIAGIIAMRPDCIVLDEPTAMLDPSGRQEVIATIKSLNKQYGITCVLITHNMDEAALADRVVVLEMGKILLDGTPKQIFSEYEILKKCGLDVPQITELAYQLKKEGLAIPDGILTVEEFVDVIEQVMI